MWQASATKRHKNSLKLYIMTKLEILAERTRKKIGGVIGYSLNKGGEDIAMMSNTGLVKNA